MYDLCCGEGGIATVALAMGWRVIGIDNKPQPLYPGEFILADALSPPLISFADLVWVSPPCQVYQRLNHAPSKYSTPKIVNSLRTVAKALSPHYIIENVQDCYDLHDPIRLCGQMFGLSLIRHRSFETSFTIPQPPHVKHSDNWVTVAGHSKGVLAKWKQAMGFSYMTRHGLAQAVPYAYVKYILSWYPIQQNKPRLVSLSTAREPGTRPTDQLCR